MRMGIVPLVLPLAALFSAGASAAGFFEDSKASLSLRNYYFNNDVRSADTPSQNQWGQGATFNYQSGFTQGVIGFGLDVTGLLGLKLDDGGYSGKPQESRSPAVTGLLPLESNGQSQDSFSSLGPTAKARFGQTEARLGILIPMLPVVWRSDGRLVPQTFQGWQIQSKDLTNTTITVGRLNTARGRASSDRTELSIAGSNNPKTGQSSNQFYYGGLDYQVSKSLMMQYYYGELQNFYRQHFLGLKHDMELPIGKLKTDLRFFDSSSDGLNGSYQGRQEGYVSSGFWEGGDTSKGEVDNRTWSAMFTWLYGGHSVGLGYEKLAGNSGYQFLNQGDGANTYLITERQINPFNNPNERSWLGQYRYDFAALGVPGLKAGLTYVKGDEIKSAAGEQEEWERDFELSYAFQSGPLKNLSVIWYNATFKSDVRGDINQDRLIFNYSIPLL